MSGGISSGLDREHCLVEQGHALGHRPTAQPGSPLGHQCEREQRGVGSPLGGVTDLPGEVDGAVEVAAVQGVLRVEVYDVPAGRLVGRLLQKGPAPLNPAGARREVAAQHQQEPEPDGSLRSSSRLALRHQPLVSDLGKLQRPVCLAQPPRRVLPGNEVVGGKLTEPAGTGERLVGPGESVRRMSRVRLPEQLRLVAHPPILAPSNAPVHPQVFPSPNRVTASLAHTAPVSRRGPAPFTVSGWSARPLQVGGQRDDRYVRAP